MVHREQARQQHWSEAINETLMRESQVMVCAQSNMAVDWICEKLIDRGINVLRIGNPTGSER